MTPERITPDYSVIKKYFIGTGNEESICEGYFKNHYDYYKDEHKTEFEYFTNLLNEYHLTEDYNLYFFWVYYFSNGDFTTWLKEVELFKIWNNYNKDLDKLKAVFIAFQFTYPHNLKTEKSLFLKSISFELISSKGVPKTTRITAHPLLYDIFRQLEDFVQRKGKATKPKEKNVKTYLNDFILSTKPLFGYLKDTHFQNKSKNKVYNFIGEFIKALGIDLENLHPSTSALEQIKSIYTKRGKTAPCKT